LRRAGRPLGAGRVERSQRCSVRAQGNSFAENQRASSSSNRSPPQRGCSSRSFNTRRRTLAKLCFELRPQAR
jgi:hypothetical protein